MAVSSYVEQQDFTEKVDITKLNTEISQIVSKQSQLRTQIDAIVKDIEGSEK
jgi:type I restriction enzyme M protein